MDAVIVATARTPIGRANKGSLVDFRPDDLSATIVQALLAKVPALDPREVEDVIWGTAQPAGEGGYNLGRVVAILAGLEQAPGVTVNRYCSSSLQTIRMAAHAIRAGEGDVFVSGGVETVSRFVHGAADGMPGTENQRFDPAQERTAARREGGQPSWTPFGGLPDIYIAMGQTAENVAEYSNVTREEMDEFAALSQQRAVESQENGFFEREITPVTRPDGQVVAADDGPRPGTTVEKLATLLPVFRPDGRVTAGNACPLNDGAAAVVVMSEERANQLGIEPLARIVSSGVTALDPEIMGLGPIEACKMALVARQAQHRRHRSGRDQRSVRGAGDPVGTRARHPVGEAQRARRRHRARPPVRHDRRADHDHPAQRPRGLGRPLRHGEHVRRRRPGHGHDRRTPLTT